MSPTIRFDPIADTTPFDAIQVKLEEENKAYLVGFIPNEYSEGTDDPEDAHKFDIVPCDSLRGSQMKHPLAAIWYWDYKVLILPADHINIYFQRAMPNNKTWNKIKAEHAFDLANPYMTVLNDAINIRIDTTPVTGRRAEYIKLLHDLVHPNHDIREHEHLIKYFHAGIESPEDFMRHSGKDIIAKVSVTWSAGRQEVEMGCDHSDLLGEAENQKQPEVRDRDTANQ